MTVYRRLLALFTSDERRLFFIVTILMVMVGLSEVLGISAVLVLLNTLSGPQSLPDNPIAQTLSGLLGISDPSFFRAFVSLLSAGVFFTSLAFRASGYYAIVRFSTMRGYTIATRLFRSYLQRPFTWSLQQNSSEMQKKVVAEVDQLVGQVLVPSMQLLSNLISGIFIVCFLIFFEPLISFIAALLFGVAYSLIFLFFKDILRDLGVRRLHLNSDRYKVATEAFGGFKEVKLMALEDSFEKRFGEPVYQIARVDAKASLVTNLPRFALEGLAFVCMGVLVMILLAQSGSDAVTLLPILGAFGFAAMRLLPLMQQVFFCVSSMRSGLAVLDQLSADYSESLSYQEKDSSHTCGSEKMDQSVELRNVSFSYCGSQQPSIASVSLEIPARSVIGFVGGSGAGKSTLIDLIMGLLVPDEGEILVDGKTLLPSMLKSWQSRIGYVPQSIYLSDATVAENIAFGRFDEKIDIHAVEKAARMASLDDFVQNEMPRKYDTLIGERGARLSGGQRQRIGIARALFRDPDLLVLDEATSALDSITERAVMETVKNVHGKKTIVIIAHRLTTVRSCDKIYLMDRGKVGACGTYDQLIEDNEVFRSMALGT